MTDGEAAETVEGLRGVVRYGPEGPELVRDPTETGDVDVEPTAVDLFRTVTSERFPDEPYGTHLRSVHRFEDVTVVHLPDGPDRGTVATLSGGTDGSVDRLIERVKALCDK
ncbi:hypothetical protein [Halovivax gelatinilyticus]|uniref:hypothetical protein n=1 Tax=Halovivax gelatinilyticus TaxID=2961597 RepID=UPI0020CA8999|nr:hypothetical protein [Halovivax gelatinilyticus]